MLLSGSALELLKIDEEYALYRAQLNGASVASVLLLSPVSTRPSLGTLQKLEHEYSFKKELDPTWAVRPLEMSEYNDRKVLALEDPGGELLSRLIQTPMEMDQFLR